MTKLLPPLVMTMVFLRCKVVVDAWSITSITSLKVGGNFDMKCYLSPLTAISQSTQCLNKGSSHLHWCKPRRGLSRCPWGRWSWREYQHGWLERKQQPHWGSAGRNATPRSSARGPGKKKVRERDSSWKDTLSPMLFSILCVYSNSGVCDL